MKKLIAQRPVLYLGRSYERGAALPSQDQTMTEAWLRAGSAVWLDDGPPPGDTSEGEPTQKAQEPAQEAQETIDGEEPAQEPADEGYRPRRPLRPAKSRGDGRRAERSERPQL